MARIRNILNDPRYLEFRERYYDSVVDYVLDHCRFTMTFQQLEVLEAIQKPGSRVAVSSGHGCFGKGTGVLMFDGSVKNVEDVRVGDVLMGDDSTPRNVLELKRGRERMYRFEYMDAKKNGSSHVFNESHILCLVSTQSHGLQICGEHVFPTVGTYLNWSNRKRRTHAIYRREVQYPRRHLLLPPYILGVWLGDGNSNGRGITSPDVEIINELRAYCDSEGCSLSTNDIFHGVKGRRCVTGDNAFYESLRHYGLVNNKHIPEDYMLSSIEDRLHLLAGIIDTDGYKEPRGRGYEVAQKDESLAKQIVSLCRSVGVHASCVRKTKYCTYKGERVYGEYSIVSISRNVEKIPIRVERKKANTECNIQRPNLHFGIRNVEPLGVGDYYGFILDGNNRFLGSDYTVLHNTGKTFLYAWFLDHHLRVYPFSGSTLIANKISQAKKGIWRYLDLVIYDVESKNPWMKGFFIKSDSKYYANGYKFSWSCEPKGAKAGQPESLAGEHGCDYAVVVDEASSVPDENHGVLLGALTHERNRYIMASQPTRPTGYFAEAMTTLAKKTLPDGRVEGLYDAFILNSEESPLVSRQFIAEKLVQYGGHNSPEYQIKVLGRLPDNLSGYLIPKSWCEQAQYETIEHREAYGWVLTVDVAEGVHRDSSVATMGKVSGFGPERMVECAWQEEFLDKNEKEFARWIASVYRDPKYPALTIAVDADGAGRTVILELEELGIPCERIHWGLPCHSTVDKGRFLNQRAFAHVKLREAIFERRFRAPMSKKWVAQASKLPYSLNEKGQYKMMGKDQMKSEGIKSPDLSDTTCFFFLVDYIACEGGGRMASAEDDFLALAKAAMGE